MQRTDDSCVKGSRDGWYVRCGIKVFGGCYWKLRSRACSKETEAEGGGQPAAAQMTHVNETCGRSACVQPAQGARPGALSSRQERHLQRALIGLRTG